MTTSAVASARANLILTVAPVSARTRADVNANWTQNGSLSIKHQDETTSRRLENEPAKPRRTR
jgi:hypothetical protein